VNLPKGSLLQEISKANKTKTEGKFTQASRVEVRSVLKNLHFPLMKQNLIQQALKHGASREVIGVLKSLPDKEYTNAADVSKWFEGQKISTSTRP
jgi:Protein of unknown function (DUF2795)